ncbi:MAG: chemotaxis protein CheW [Candidatus Polarisedimenticolaceae bacterium]|nr:chemotaxis protein CheW [Candidatus Polarisedimenticolaceae bacterium]
MSEQAAKSENADDNKDQVNNEYLTFILGAEAYGVDILRVQEIRGWEMVTRIPNSPSYVRGVLNLRGAIVPVFDLRERIALDPIEYSKETVVIVLRVKNRTSERSMGIVVDAVSDVLNTGADSIRNTPEFGHAIATEYICGLVESDGKMVMLLDVDRLLNYDAEIENIDVDVA